MNSGLGLLLYTRPIGVIKNPINLRMNLRNTGTDIIIRVLILILNLENSLLLTLPVIYCGFYLPVL